MRGTQTQEKPIANWEGSFACPPSSPVLSPRLSAEVRDELGLMFRPWSAGRGALARRPGGTRVPSLLHLHLFGRSQQPCSGDLYCDLYFFARRLSLPVYTSCTHDASRRDDKITLRQPVKYACVLRMVTYVRKKLKDSRKYIRFKNRVYWFKLGF